MASTRSGMNTNYKDVKDPKLQTPLQEQINSMFNIPKPLNPAVPTPPATTPTPSPTANTDKVYRNGQGEIGGITVGGETYLGLTPQDVEAMAQADQVKKKGGVATQALEAQATQQAMTVQQQAAAAQQSQIQQQNADLANSVISPINVGNPQASQFDYRQAALSGTRSAIPSILTNVGAGAGIGAVAGGAAGLGIGAIPGAAIGAGVGLIKGVYSAVTSNLEGQASDSISAQSKVLTDGKGNLRKLIALVKADPTRADQYLDSYQQQKDRIAQAYGKLKLETKRDINKFLGKDGTLALQSYENFYSDGGLAQQSDLNMQLALLGKNPDLTELVALSDEKTQ